MPYRACSQQGRTQHLPAPIKSSVDLAYQEGKWGDLEEDPQLGLGGGAGHVGEHTTLLDQDLVHVGHHAAGVPQSVLLLNVVLDLQVEDEKAEPRSVNQIDEGSLDLGTHQKGYDWSR